MPETPEQKILEKQVETADKKAIIFDMMISLAEKEYNIQIRKKCSPEQSTTTEKKQKRQETADQILRMVKEVRQQMPRIGTRKLCRVTESQQTRIIGSVSIRT